VFRYAPHRQVTLDVASKKEKLAVIDATQYSYYKVKKEIFSGGLK